MGRKQEIERYQAGFVAGMENAVEILQNGGDIDALKDSLRARKAWKVEPMPDAILDQLFVNGTKMAIVSQGILTCAALHDLFGFGEQRLRRVMERVEKAGHYLQKGWITYFDMVEELKSSTKYEALVVEENKKAFGKYWRPDLEDTWTPDDFIPPDVYQAMLKKLDMREEIKGESHDIYFQDGRYFYSWEGKWEQVQAFDVLCGMFSQRVYEMLPPDASVPETIQAALGRTDPFGVIQEELAKWNKEHTQEENKPQETEVKKQPHSTPRGKRRKKR